MLTPDQSRRLDDILRDALTENRESKLEGCVFGFINLKESIDSMVATETVIRIEKEFGIDLPNTLELGTVDDLRAEVGRLLE